MYGTLYLIKNKIFEKNNIRYRVKVLYNTSFFEKNTMVMDNKLIKSINNNGFWAKCVIWQADCSFRFK